MRLYEERDWRPVVAPELEFFLAAKNIDPDYPLQPPAGKTGRPQTGRQAYGIDAVNEFDPLFEDVYDYCEAQDIGIDSLIHEEGVAQVEINFNHGDPIALADQTFLFKRTVRQAALRHDIYATFMAKPYEQEPGSAMHIHQSVVDTKRGRSLFSTKKRQRYPSLPCAYCGPAKTSARSHAADRAVRELLSPACPLSFGAHQHALGT